MSAEKLVQISIVLAVAALVSACADLGYYLHTARGQMDILAKRQPIEGIIADEKASPRLKNRLEQVLAIRRFAFEQLSLPRSGSYSDYADLQRSYAVKNLFAAPEFSTQAIRWCYPVVGCAGYRGFFDQERLQKFVADLHAQGHDTFVANVSAYSTLGWFDDPVLNTFVYWPEPRLAGLIFHELAHQQLFIDGDTKFNESFATTVQVIGVKLWLDSQSRQEMLRRYETRLANRKQVIDLIALARQELQAVYDAEFGDDEKRQRKTALIEQLKQDYRMLAASFAEPEGFARWFDREINNAQLLSVSTYHGWVPSFTALFEYSGKDFKRFYELVAELGDQPKQQRAQCLDQLLHAQSPQSAQSCFSQS